ncbi:MAG: 5-(carboxyamino)imidazole ribonucleotide synthase [Planctomycetaceae bacterium]|nr:5-(carboxyamino)imidazole ribonucleotide synthase [Planctomycetaceae bacterium]
MQPILPGSTLGVLGSGQLGRMFAFAAHQLGYHVHTYSHEPNSPCGQVAEQEFVGDYNDTAAIANFARSVDVVTFEFENISSDAARVIEQEGLVYPGGHVLHISQHRIREKTTLSEAGLPVTPFLPVRNQEDLEHAAAAMPFPCILKTAFGGYDGKGQVSVPHAQSLASAWEELGQQEAILEQRIEFTHEISVVAVRSTTGELCCCGPIRNEHRNHILDLSVWPDPEMSRYEIAAREIARGVLETLDVVGVMCIEMFVTRDNQLMINEVAPRPHNSGHLTIEACCSSQFEQQVRAICGLPLGCMQPRHPAAMANLLGDLWSDGEPNWVAALQDPRVKLHLYGKHSARPGRKMGHLTCVADSAEEAARTVLAAREALHSR